MPLRLCPQPRLSPGEATISTAEMGRPAAPRQVADGLSRRRGHATSTEIGKMFLICDGRAHLRAGLQGRPHAGAGRPQGTLKSPPARPGRRWFSDNLPDITGRQGSLAASARQMADRGREMHAMSKAEASLLKSSSRARPNDIGRPMAGGGDRAAPVRLHRHHQQGHLSARRDRRPAVLAGQVRHDQHRAPRRGRDQLFAEAVALYRRGVAWWPDREFEQRYITAEQVARYVSDPWEPVVRKYLANKTSVSLLEVFVGALKYEIEPPFQVEGEPRRPRGTPINRVGISDQRRLGRRHDCPRLGAETRAGHGSTVLGEGRCDAGDAIDVTP